MKNDFRRLNTLESWTLNISPTIAGQGRCLDHNEKIERVKLVDSYTRRLYIAGSYSFIQKLTDRINERKSLTSLRLVEKYVDFTEN
ncbi:MAG: hypothetical protein N3A69_05565 [Leptospiraceae bacterium]|nr:hypothetical protein [Leptospiraceae bacterium]